MPTSLHHLQCLSTKDHIVLTRSRSLSLTSLQLPHTSNFKTRQSSKASFHTDNQRIATSPDPVRDTRNFAVLTSQPEH